MRGTRAVLGATAALGLLSLAGCGATPGGGGDDGGGAAKGGGGKVDVAKAGKVTLTVWDQEVRGGQNAQMRQLNSEFQAKYPNVTIKRVAKSFEDLNTTLKLAASGPKAPDVVEANQGRPVMGQMVKGKLLRPLNSYAKAYGWSGRYSPLLLNLNKFSADGRQFGSGNLYGLSQMGEIVGVFYNKDKVSSAPRTFADFESQLADAKRAGDVPIQFGNLDKWPGIHEFQTVQNEYADKSAVRNFVFAKPGASFDAPANQQTAAKLQEWVRKGYFTPNFNGTGYDPAWQQFAKGKGRFLIAGTWVVADLYQRMRDKVGFMVMPGKDAGAQPVSLGGESLPFAITSKSKHPDVAAAYIDFITNAHAQEVLTRTNNLPAMTVGTAQPTSSLSKDVASAWKSLNEADGLVPYLDYSTPDFSDQVTGAIQEMLALKDTPKAFTSKVQSDYAQFTSSL
jgi:raffinose/stachyose/melibiose transport system substrate-binding protein